MINCPTCYPYNLQSCVDTINIDAGLANGAYTVTVKDHFGNVYVIGAIVYGGPLVIDVADLPPYLLNPHGGAFELEVFSGESCTPETLTFDEVDYTCIQLKVINTTGGETIATIPCE